MTRSRSSTLPVVRVRILSGSAIALGPGKAELLEAIDATGSISAGARQMHMSYRRAWLLVQTMNACFAEPLVESTKGGEYGGGAALTPAGMAALAAYRTIARRAEEAFRPLLAKSRRSSAGPKR